MEKRGDMVGFLCVPGKRKQEIVDMEEQTPTADDGPGFSQSPQTDHVQPLTITDEDAMR